MRRARGARGALKRVSLTSRDFELLRLVGLARYVATDQLAREFFPTPDRCRRRLRELLDAGFIRVLMTSSTEPNLVALASPGLAALLEHSPTLKSEVRPAGTIALVGVTHHLGIVDTRLYLANLARLENGALRRFESGRARWSETLGLPDLGLVPDALAELRLGKDTVKLGVEVDCGTESFGDLRAKFAKYREVIAADILDELWVVVTAPRVRVEHLLILAGASGIGEATRVMHVGAVRERPVKRPMDRVAKILAGGRAGANRDSVPNSASPSRSISSSHQGVPGERPAAVGRIDRTPVGRVDR